MASTINAEELSAGELGINPWVCQQSCLKRKVVGAGWRWLMGRRRAGRMQGRRTKDQNSAFGHA